MTVESKIFDLLKGLVSNRVFPDQAPEGALVPYITYQQVGGFPISFLEAAMPSKKNGRFQITVWSTSRAEAASLNLQIEAALIAATTVQASALDSPVARFDPETSLRGSQQDFSVWSDR